MTPRPAPILKLQALSKAFGDAPVLDNVDLSIGPGERVVLVGPNGSGKTTVLRIVVGLLEPSSGEVSIMGAAPGSVEARSVTAYLPDNPVLYDDLSVNEHLYYVARLHGEDGARAPELVEKLGLASRADDLPARFSRGLRQKTGIALAFVRPFSLLVVDEPFVGLDRPGREALLELFDEAVEGGATVVVATHQPDFLSRATRCIALADGAVRYDGRPDAAIARELLG